MPQPPAIAPQQKAAAGQETEAGYQRLLESLLAIVWRADPDTYQITYVSKAAELLGYPLSAWTTEQDFWQNHIHPDDRDWAIEYCATETAALRPHTFEYRMLAADGRIVWLYDVVELVVEDGRPRELVGLMVDITERKRMEEELKSLAEKDFLTEIYNRRKFQELLKSEISRLRRYPGPFSLIMFDIDDFKHINDEHGHDAGDAVLCELATLVSGYIRETDIFARYGGEEFIIMATETGPEAAQAITEKLRLTIEQHEFSHAGRLTASFGVIGWRAGDSLDSLLKRVDESLYQAKKQGKNRVFTTGR